MSTGCPAGAVPCPGRPRSPDPRKPRLRPAPVPARLDLNWPPGGRSLHVTGAATMPGRIGPIPAAEAPAGCGSAHHESRRAEAARSSARRPPGPGNGAPIRVRTRPAAGLPIRSGCLPAGIQECNCNHHLRDDEPRFCEPLPGSFVNRRSGSLSHPAPARYARLRGYRTVRAFPVTRTCRSTDIPKNETDKQPVIPLTDGLLDPGDLSAGCSVKPGWAGPVRCIA